MLGLIRLGLTASIFMLPLACGPRVNRVQSIRLSGMRGFLLDITETLSNDIRAGRLTFHSIETDQDLRVAIAGRLVWIDTSEYEIEVSLRPVRRFRVCAPAGLHTTLGVEREDLCGPWLLF